MRYMILQRNMVVGDFPVNGRIAHFPDTYIELRAAKDDILNEVLHYFKTGLCLHLIVRFFFQWFKMTQRKLCNVYGDMC